MALEAVVFQKDPFVENALKEFSYNMGWYDDFGPFQSFQEDQKPCITENLDIKNNGDQTSYNINCWDSSPQSISPLVAHQNNNSNNITTSSSSPENILTGGDHVFFSTSSEDHQSSLVAPNMSTRIRKRRRERTLKNKADMENQRMTHIAVERNRRRQMNDYLAILRSLMPPSYSQRGDQASIVGGVINFVKELEQLLQYLESRKPAKIQRQPLSNFFTFPQYTTTSPTIITDQSNNNTASLDVTSMMERRSGIADIEVNMVDTHSNIKVLVKRGPKQLLKMVTGLQSLGFTVLHLNITTVDRSVLYSFSVKVEDECQLSTVNEIATAVHEIVEMIQRETTTSSSMSV